MTTFNQTVLVNYLSNSANGLSIGEAFVNYQISGGHLTKIVSNARKSGHNIVKQWRINPVTKRRYARYHLIPVTCAALRYINGKAF
jgi:hypothetical protein